MCETKYYISTTENEGFGMPSIEAMASKCIPIVPNIGGTNDFCLDKINSFKYNLNDINDFKRVLNNIFHLDQAQINEMQDSCLLTSKKYLWKNTLLMVMPILLVYFNQLFLKGKLVYSELHLLFSIVSLIFILLCDCIQIFFLSIIKCLV